MRKIRAIAAVILCLAYGLNGKVQGGCPNKVSTATVPVIATQTVVDDFTGDYTMSGTWENPGQLTLNFEPAPAPAVLWVVAYNNYGNQMGPNAAVKNGRVTLTNLPQLPTVMIVWFKAGFFVCVNPLGGKVPDAQCNPEKFPGEPGK